MADQPGRRTAAIAGPLAALAVALAPLSWHLPVASVSVPDVAAIYTTQAIYPSDVALAGLAVLGRATARRQAPRTNAPGTWLGWSGALLAGGAALSALWTPTPAMALGVALHLALLTLAFRALRPLAVAPSWLVAGLMAAAIPQALLAVGQYLTQTALIPEALRLPWLPSAEVNESGAPAILNEEGQRVLRAFGTFSHPNVLGGWLALALVLLPSLSRNVGRFRPVLFLAGLILAAGLLATFSRAAWLATLLGLATWGLGRLSAWTPRQWLVAGALASLLLLVTMSQSEVRARLFPTPDNPLELRSTSERLWLVEMAWATIQRRPVLGAGVGNAGSAAVADGLSAWPVDRVHVVPLLVVAEMGVLGLLALLPGGVALATMLLRQESWPCRQRTLAVLAALGPLALLDHYLWSLPVGRTLAWGAFAWIALTYARNVQPAAPREAQRTSTGSDLPAPRPMLQTALDRPL